MVAGADMQASSMVQWLIHFFEVLILWFQREIADGNLQKDWWLNFSSCGFSYVAPLGVSSHLELMWLVNVKEKLQIEFTLSIWRGDSLWFTFMLNTDYCRFAAIEDWLARHVQRKPEPEPVHIGSHWLKGGVLVEHFCSGEEIQRVVETSACCWFPKMLWEWQGGPLDHNSSIGQKKRKEKKTMTN